MKKIGTLLTITIFSILFSTIISTTASAVSVNCTYGVDFQNNSVWNITGNNITICDHENLDLYNVTLNVSDNATLILNGTNLSINVPMYSYSQFQNNSVLIIKNNSNLTSQFSIFNFSTNAVFNSTNSFVYVTEIVLLDNSQTNIDNQQGSTLIGLNNNSNGIITNSEDIAIDIYDQSTLTAINLTNFDHLDIRGGTNLTLTNITGNSSFSELKLELQDLTLSNMNITNLKKNESSTGTIISNNGLNVTFNNFTIKSIDTINLTVDNLIFENCSINGTIFITIQDVLVQNSILDSFDEVFGNSNSIATIINSTITNSIRTSTDNLTIQNTQAGDIDSNGNTYVNLDNVTLTGDLSTHDINYTEISNSIIPTIRLEGNQITFLGSNNTITNVTVHEESTPTVTKIIGNLTPTNYDYNGIINNSINRSFLVRLERPVAGYSVCVLENLSNTSDCYYTNTTDSNGEAEVYIYFQNSSDVDYLYIQYQNQSIIANITKDYLITANADVTPPTMELGYDNLPIYGGEFSFNINSTCNWSTYNISRGNSVWSYGDAGLNSSSNTSTLTFDGIYLPTGKWNFTVTVFDEYNNSNSTTQGLISNASILAELVSDDKGETYIGGSNVVFSFNITTKGYPYVKSYLILKDGNLTYNSVAYASLNNGSKDFSVSGSGTYSNADAATIQLIDNSSIPSYINMSASSLGEIYQNTNMQLILRPYSGLSAGEYSGSYGFGLDDGN